MNDEADPFPERLPVMPGYTPRPRHPWWRFFAVPVLVCVTRGATGATGPVFLLALIAVLALVACAGAAVLSMLAALFDRDGRRAAIEAGLAALASAGVAMAWHIIASTQDVDPC